MNSLQTLKEIGDMKSPRLKIKPPFTHLIHPYPAKYIPEIPNKLITEFSNERHVVFDPFCGSGTTLLEARLLGRESVGVDLNPIGVLISRVKTYCLTKQDKEFFIKYRSTIIQEFGKTKPHYWIPDIPKLNHWFSEPAIIGLSKLIDVIRTVQDVNCRRILNLIFSNIVVAVSNQESETRFAAIPKNISIQKVLELYINKYDSTLKRLDELSKNEKLTSAHCDIYLDNTLNTKKYLKENSVDLIITSPPYLNSFDYYLYHKFRILWLGYPENLTEVLPIAKIQEDEIGSRYKYSGKNSDNITVFETEMEECFKTFNYVLKPSKMLFFVIGDSIVNGNFLQMDKFYDQLAAKCGFELVSKISYSMTGASKSFVATNTVNKHYSKKQTHILAFQSINLKKINGLEIHKPKSNEKILVLPSAPKKEAIIVNCLPANIDNGNTYLIKTNQVTDYTHGIVKYPAKYIPQIPNWAILNFSKKGDLVLDPFNGSGTTSLESLIHHRSFVGLDINPISVLASDVKTTFISETTIEKELRKFKEIIKKLKTSNKIEKVDFGLKEFWFNKEVLKDLFTIKTAINKLSNEKVKKLFLVSLSSIIKKVSYLDESQLKVKRDHKKLLNGVPEVLDLFLKRVEKDKVLIQTLKPFSKFKENNSHFLGSAFNLKSHIKTRKKFDLIVTSPPYINAMNYPMYHRYELLILGLIHPEKYISHQEDYIGTERVYAKDYKEFSPFLSDSEKFQSLNDKLKVVYEREPKRYYITKRYFQDMYRFFEQAYDLLKPGKKLVIVCGRNTIKQVNIDTSFELSKIAQEVGFKENFYFEYEIQKHRFKITRHETAGKINTDVVVVLEK